MLQVNDFSPDISNVLIQENSSNKREAGSALQQKVNHSSLVRNSAFGIRFYA
jgi:hypothetical protein